MARRTPKSKLDEFLVALAEHRNVMTAADAVGLGYSTVYQHRKKEKAFADKWDACLPLRQFIPIDDAEKERFLTLYRATGDVHEAAKALGHDPKAFYEHRHKDAAFDAEWSRAFEATTSKLADEAMRRALATSDTLLIFLLKSRDPARYAEFTRLAIERNPETLSDAELHRIAAAGRDDDTAGSGSQRTH